MIKRLQIKGYGCHKKLDIIFDPGINVIVGQNYAGKSTVLRSIKYVAKNKPPGLSIINWDSKKAAVRLTFGENKVTRVRGKLINTYQLNDNLYKAFGSDVPIDIQKVIGLSDINFQGQHDPPFWFSETAGEVSRKLNSIVNLEVIDKILAGVASLLRSENTIAQSTIVKIDKATQLKESLKYAKQMDKEFSAIEAIQTDLVEKRREWTELHECLEGIQTYTSIYMNNRAIVSGLQKPLKIGKEIEIQANQIKILLKLLNNAAECKEIIKTKPPSLAHCRGLEQKLIIVSNQIQNIKNIIRQIAEKEKEQWQSKENERRLQKKLQNLKTKVCPKCKGTGIKTS